MQIGQGSAELVPLAWARNMGARRFGDIMGFFK